MTCFGKDSISVYVWTWKFHKMEDTRRPHIFRLKTSLYYVERKRLVLCGDGRQSLGFIVFSLTMSFLEYQAKHGTNWLLKEVLFGYRSQEEVPVLIVLMLIVALLNIIHWERLNRDRAVRLDSHLTGPFAIVLFKVEVWLYWLGFVFGEMTSQ